MAAGPDLIEDVRKAPENVLSMRAQTFEVSMVRKTMRSYSQGLPQFIQPEYTLRVLNMDDDYSTEVIRSKLTRNIAVTFKEVREELINTMDNLIPAGKNSDGTRESYRRTSHFFHKWHRMGQGPNSRDSSTGDLQRHEPCFCWGPSMSVVILQFFHSIPSLTLS